MPLKTSFATYTTPPSPSQLMLALSRAIHAINTQIRTVLVASNDEQQQVLEGDSARCTLLHAV